MAHALLHSEQYTQIVRGNESFWLIRGAQGVTALIFDDRHLLNGAKGVDRFAIVLRKLAKKTAAEKGNNCKNKASIANIE